MNKRLKTIGIICIVTSIITLIVGLIFVNDISAAVGFNFAAVGFNFAAVGYILISIGKTREENKLRKEKYILNYEIDQLRWSYIQMGKYIDKFNLTELSDLSWRIENELRDIEIKKNNYAKHLGIKEGEE